LFKDQTAEPGKSYAYRVVARNGQGAFEPSNVMGPVAVHSRTIVDECGDLKQLHDSAGEVSIATENARTVQEDCHRFALEPGASVTYHVAGPIHNFKVYSFVRDESSKTNISLSTEDRTFRPAKHERRAFPSSQTVYGYLTSILYERAGADGEASYLRIALPESGNESRQDSRKDNEAPAAPVEISRVEIEYDHQASNTAEPPADASARSPAPVNPSIFVDSLHPLAEARKAIDDAAQRGDRRLNVVVTILADLTDDLRIKSFGSRRGFARPFEPLDAAMRDRIQDDLRQVFARMVHHHMEIFILPHIDSGGQVRAWRNWVDFDPLETYAGFSYEQVMIDTIADALADAVRPETRVELALSGEMGTSLFRYPESYRKIARQLRQRPDLRQVKIGISLNHTGISGQGNPSNAENIALTEKQRAQMQLLIDESDFIGMSFYRPVSVPPRVGDFVRGVDNFMEEFREHGLSVPFGTPIHFSEVGIGGGHDEDDIASDPAKAAETPWGGSGNPRNNPWRNPAMQQLRRQYHHALLKFLEEQPARWPVSAAFFWSTGSWDPQGVRHSVFADQEISRAIQVHNQRIRSDGEDAFSEENRRGNPQKVLDRRQTQP
jgi:hypothetical protein